MNKVIFGAILQGFDKLIAFFFPIFVFYIYKDKSSFVEIEIALAFIAILTPVISMGSNAIVLRKVKNYGVNNLDLAVAESIRLVIFGIIAGLGLMVISVVLDLLSANYVAHILVRALYVAFLALLVKERLVVFKQGNAFFFSIIIWVLVYLFLILEKFLVNAETSLSASILILSIPSGLGLCLIFWYFFGVRKVFCFNDCRRGFVGDLKWSTNLVIAAFLTAINVSYARIYVGSNFNSEDAVSLIFWLRIALVLQLVHSITSLVLSRTLMLSDGGNLFKEWMFYIFGSTIATIVLFAFIFFGTWFIEVPHISLISFSMLIFYVLFWNGIALMEVFFQKNDFTLGIVGVSAMGAIFLLFIIHNWQPENVFELSLSMLVSLLPGLFASLSYVIYTNRFKPKIL